MRIIKPNRPIELPNHYTLQGGECYIYAGKQAADIEKLAISRHGPAAIEMDPTRFEWVYREYQGEDLDGKTLFLWRTGGAGDLAEMKPAIQYAKKKWPTCRIVYCVERRYASIFEGDPHIDELRTYPVRLKWLEGADYHLCFEALVEENEDAKHMHVADLFLNKLGYRGLEPREKIPVLPCHARAVTETDELFDKHKFEPDDLVIGVQLHVEAPIRRYPPAFIAAAVKELANSLNAKFLWIGSPNQAQDIDVVGINRYKLGSRSINLPAKEKHRTWQHTIAAVAKCDMVLSADSSTAHIAGSNKHIVGSPEEMEKALNSPYRFGFDFKNGRTHTPQVTIYGPFGADQRIAYFGHATGIDIDCICRRCNQHGYSSCRLAAPLMISPCLALLQVSYVATSTIEALIHTNGRRPDPKPVPDVESFGNVQKSLITKRDIPRLAFAAAPNYVGSLTTRAL